MSVVELNGLKVTLGDPIQVAEGIGHCWFPQMEKFSTGELIASVSIHADAHGLSVHAQRIYISEDQGRTWQYRHTVTDAGLSVKVPRPNGDMLVLPGRTAPDPPGQWRNFSGPYVRYRDGGKRIEIEAGGMRVEGLPPRYSARGRAQSASRRHQSWRAGLRRRRLGSRRAADHYTVRDVRRGPGLQHDLLRVQRRGPDLAIPLGRGRTGHPPGQGPRPRRGEHVRAGDRGAHVRNAPGWRPRVQPRALI